MESGNLPVFIGINAAAAHLGCWQHQVEKKLGGPDIIVRIGVRDDKAWLKARIDGMINFQESPVGVLWTHVEAARRIGLGLRPTLRLLNQPIAWLENTNASRRLPLFAESQLDAIRDGIARGTIKVQRRSLKTPKKGCCLTEARHTLASDLATEAARIRAKQREAAFWANLV